MFLTLNSAYKGLRTTSLERERIESITSIITLSIIIRIIDSLITTKLVKRHKKYIET